MTQEIEAKYVVESAEAFRLIADQWDVSPLQLYEISAIRQTDVYYDTPEGDLVENGSLLRLRIRQDRQSITVKRKRQGVRVRDEWEIECNDALVAALDEGRVERLTLDPEAQRALEPAKGVPIAPILRADTARECWFVQFERGRVKVCFDETEYTSGLCASDRTELGYEVEIERIDGDPELPWEIGSVFARYAELIPATMSKYERGRRLLFDEHDTAATFVTNTSVECLAG